VLMNAHHEPSSFRLPGEGAAATWTLELDTADPERAPGGAFSGEYPMAGRSLVVLRQPLAEKAVRDAAGARERAVRREALRRRRRAGVLVPLFSIRTGTGWGLGEIPDLGRFAGWAGKAGFSVIEILPVNETSGLDASPYAAASAFAIDPAYLALDECEDFVAAGGRAALPPELQAHLRRVAAAPRVDWPSVRRLKQAGIALAFERFRREEWARNTRRARELGDFMRAHTSWLDDHALFRAWHDRFAKSWLDWPADARDRDPGALARLRAEHPDDILRTNWVQWQLDRQWRNARRAASAAGVELMGDFPFVVGVDSSDVWAHRTLFRTDLHVGTPPEPGAPEGQDWGLPVYDWEAMARDGFAWLRERANRAASLYSLYRVDHAMGFYRTYYRSADGRETGFLPADENEQVQLGETLMRLQGHRAEVIAEDLGVLPTYLRPSLEKLRVPGYRVLRWEKDGDAFRDPAAWPESSVATNATHDTETTAVWFEALAPEERAHLREVPGLAELPAEGPFDARARDLLLRVVYNAPSTLALVTFQDATGTRERINNPAKNDGVNWTYRIAQPLDALLADQATIDRLGRLSVETGRQARPPAKNR
jgi:4-alpha-glucanotransferase